MQVNEAHVLELIYDSEKGFANHPRDPGGPTQDGVTQRTLSAWEHRNVTVEELKQLTEEKRNEIYKKQYFAPLQFDKLRSGLDLAVADCAINSGPGRAIRLLQEASGMRERYVDGICGELTLRAMNAAKDLDGLIAEYSRRRLAFCRQLETWDVFGNGWTHRINVVESESVALAHSTFVTANGDRATMPETASAKADGAIKLSSTGSGKAAIATIGSVAGVVVVASAQAVTTLQPFGSLQMVRYLLIGLAVVSATAGFLQALTRAKAGATT